VSAARVRAALTRGTVVLDAERCKGCGLCIPACRPNVLAMGSITNAAGFNLPELRPGCTGCMACAEICPDFALEVWKFAEPIVMDAAGEGGDDGPGGDPGGDPGDPGTATGSGGTGADGEV